MKSIKENLLAAALVLSFIWLITPLTAQHTPDFLQGKVKVLEGTNLEQNFARAEEEFKKAGDGDTFFTGYVFQSRHAMHIGHDLEGIKDYVVKGTNDRIKVYRKSQGKTLEVTSSSSEEKSQPAAILFLRRLSGGKGEILDVSLIDLEHSYEFSESPLYWLGEVSADESLRFLEGRFEAGSRRVQKTAVFLISCHQSPRAYDFLKKVALGNYDTKLRETAVFWLGNFKDEKSLALLKEIYAKEKDRKVKEQVIFALHLSDSPEAIREIIKIAKSEESRGVRKNAIFWLGQKASEESVKALKNIVDEPEEDVKIKEQAVFAISQLPHKKAVPMLIDIAKSNKSPSVRKQAIFWLGQTGEDEALKFFEEILLKK